MPELPEVETVRKILTASVVGRTITDVEILYKNLIKSAYATFKEDIIGRKIESIGRKGKFLIFNLGEKSLIVHLRMEGKFFHLHGLEANLDKHTSLYFVLDDGSYLFFKDTRKFGVMYLKDSTAAFTEPPLTEVGPEPFEITDSAYLFKAYSRLGKPLKEALLDQKIMCGLGNIYADEVAFASRLNPFAKASSLTEQNSADIIKNARNILKLAIENGGSTIKSYHPAEGISGEFQTLLKVYGREGEKCSVCGTVLKKRFVNGRGTTFCPKCQQVPYTIGLTGELASGKTTALHIFEKLGANVFSADDEIEKLYADRGFIDRLKVKFPEAFTDGELNKTVLLTHFSQDKVYKRKYERYLWSELRSVLNDYLITHTDRPVVAEIPLLFESGYHKLFSFTVGIETEPETQEKYLVQREKDPAAAERLRTLGASNGYNRFRDKLDYIIDNSGTTKELETKIEKVYREILAK